MLDSVRSLLDDLDSSAATCRSRASFSENAEDGIVNHAETVLLASLHGLWLVW